jgi:cathepsin A (carboxypeptidase C)
MRLSSAVVLGAATSAAAFQDQPQKVLGNPSINTEKLGFDVDIDSWTKPLEDAFGKFSTEAKAIWDEVSMFAPDAVHAFKKQAAALKPKKHQRKPDSHWDSIVKGADIQGMWVQGENGDSHRKVGGRLENFNLRTKKVDPAKLGVDSVKQYTGYLDDEEKDKHLFYCK